MSALIERVLKLANEIEEFPLGNCSPSDDPDKQTAFLYSFRDIANRFLASVKRVDDKELQGMVNLMNPRPEFITEAYELKTDLIGVIDYINDIKDIYNSTLKEKTQISNNTANSLSNLVCENLIKESANNLPMLCEGYGLANGTIEEAFKSKYNYVYSRITHIEPNEIFKLAKKLKGKYPDSELDSLLNIIQDGNDVNLISKFENIRELIKNEVNKAQFTIWIAVAWFTDNELANLLYKKSKQGVNIQIIINDDKINSKLSTKLKEYFEVHLVPQNGVFNKLMHHKFCVIDLKKVIHGSYNWTVKAEYNNETISFVESKVMAEEFASEFIKLKKELS
ncbi:MULTISPECIES: phospholipase D-like domain-containing protein [Winogradskyella]|jgi:hypothetical protein|uniref:phospholipase D-like domain-containing protein n=1 Tax=Winogradskyella TaxID=286104 RepID=UPI0015CB5776|nr:MULTISPECIES: phospholipase D-like domain-containing protein [Winogradskyella]QXP78820.1 DUF1669 domain-containing protein [Winogradskyella sp. HaHa_3_26]